MLSKWDKKHLSKEEQDRIGEYTAMYNTATHATQQKYAHEQAEAIRLSHGYSGGTDGSMYLTE